MNELPTKLPAFFWRFIRPHRWAYCVLFLMAGYWAAYASIAPYTLKLILDSITEHPSESIALTLFTASSVYLAFYVLWELSYRVWDYVFLKTIPQVQQAITEAMFAYVHHHSHTYFQKNLPGSISNRIYDASWGSAVLSQLCTNQLFTQLLTMVVAVVAVYTVQAQFATLLFAWVLVFLSVTFLLSKKAYALSGELANVRTGLMGQVVDSLSNHMNVRLFSQQNKEVRHLHKYTDHLKHADQNMQRFMLLIKAIQGALVFCLVVILLLLLTHFHRQGLVSVGDFALVLGVAKAVIDAVKDLAAEFVNLFEELGSCSKALSLVRTPHQLSYDHTLPALAVPRGEICFRNVSFDYERNNNVFENKSITIAPGERVGLVGFSGSGKSTFIHLILRYFDIRSGSIAIDGQNIAHCCQHSLRQHVTMIPQDITLFQRSVMDNIRYAKPDASDEEVMVACKKAHCHEFIEELPEGYATELGGETGVRLSGGQRQRIAIARAFLRDSKILLLDEATSSLDLATEQGIQESLIPLMKGKTTLIIAHRLSTLAHVDRILVFHKGHIIEDGSHEELIAKGGHYLNLWAMQANGWLPG